MNDGTLVAGIDSSTQSTKVLLVRAEDGSIVASASAPHPNGTEVDPDAWWDALQRAGSGLLEQAAAIAVAGQQHGMVALDAQGAPVRDALLWNDLRSAPQGAELVDRLGGAAAAAQAIGSVPTASFTVTKLRWMAEAEPGNAGRTETVLLPHDWLTWRLGGRAETTTDHGDASGTGYYDPRTRSWRTDLADWAAGHALALPRVAGPAEAVGHTDWGAVLAPGTGDNMAAALGLGLQGGDVAVSVGTSGTAFTVREDPSADPSGAVAGFCDATGRYLPLVCTVNASRILGLVAGLLGVGHEEFAALALAADPGAGGLTLLPYLDGERTPNRPDATGVLSGLTSATSREQFARAAVEALLCSLADAVDALGVTPSRVLLIGGAARNRAVQQIAPAILHAEVQVPQPAEYVALGAARQAAWVLAGTAEPPEWPAMPGRTFDTGTAPGVRERYATLRERTVSW